MVASPEINAWIRELMQLAQYGAGHRDAMQAALRRIADLSPHRSQRRYRKVKAIHDHHRAKREQTRARQNELERKIAAARGES